MFEIGLISIILLAVGYWVTLWLMGRHDDVLHGDFVHAEDGIEASVLPDPSFADRPTFPPKPLITQPPTRRPTIERSAIMPVAANRAGPRPAAKPASAATPATPSPSASSAPASPRADRTATLQTLLASIKRDLKDASQL